MDLRRVTHHPARRLAAALAILGTAVIATRAVAGDEHSVSGRLHTKVSRAELINVPMFTPRRTTALDFDSLLGRSGQLRVRLLELGETASYPGIASLFDQGLLTPGFRTVEATEGIGAFHFVTLTPWNRKLGGYVNGYNVGNWPAELRRMPANYENPAGFIEVTRENVDQPLSMHFTLRDFITRDQQHVWPKYVVLREELLDKLELVLAALESFGVPTRNVVVLSGFRSPQYNTRGAAEGMAQASRHQFGDAADIIIDANRDGRMDDLNGDGRTTFDDLRVLDRAVQLIESRFPELVGGLGLYHAMGPSGPFAHIDVRGNRARWSNTGSRARASRWTPSAASAGVARPSGSCMAEGAMAVLCTGVR
ncbi:MAG: D-Ala-D-Ala carboxypeptidase family metallohydrolase [Gemmatimonadota bacterium]